METRLDAYIWSITWVMTSTRLSIACALFRVLGNLCSWCSSSRQTNLHRSVDLDRDFYTLGNLFCYLLWLSKFLSSPFCCCQTSSDPPEKIRIVHDALGVSYFSDTTVWRRKSAAWHQGPVWERICARGRHQKSPLVVPPKSRFWHRRIR